LKEINNRLLFYIHGFDPRSDKYYYKKFKSESQKHYDNIEISKLKNSTNSYFEVQNNDIYTKYIFLNWNNIIKPIWSKTLSQKIFTTFKVIKNYIFFGRIKNFLKYTPNRLFKGGLFPTISILFSFLIPFLISLVSFKSVFEGITLFLFSLLIGSIGSFFLLKLCNKFGVFWLSNIFHFHYLWDTKKIPKLNSQINIMALNIISEIEKSDCEEFLIIGHSIGTSMVIPVLNIVLESKRITKEQKQKIKLLTFGNCIPLITLQKNSSSYNNALKNILQNTDLTWIDYSSPLDGACFPLFDPLKNERFNSENYVNKSFKNPKFYKLYSKEKYNKIKYDWYLIHFLYLHSTPKNDSFNFFELTTSNKSLDFFLKK